MDQTQLRHLCGKIREKLEDSAWEWGNDVGGDKGPWRDEYVPPGHGLSTTPGGVGTTVIQAA